MGFEKVTLDKVAKVLKEDRKASFTCGCLFVDCGLAESKRILKVLQKDYTGTIVKSGPIQGEYAYDFC
jgi:hypothetical protein